LAAAVVGSDGIERVRVRVGDEVISQFSQSVSVMNYQFNAAAHCGGRAAGPLA